jgi:hypothetical protein
MSGICERLGVKFPGPTRLRLRVNFPGPTRQFEPFGSLEIAPYSGLFLHQERTPWALGVVRHGCA